MARAPTRGDRGSSPVNTEKKVDETRRNVLKAAAVAAAAGAIGFVAVDKEALKKVLVPVKLEDLIKMAEAEGDDLQARAAEKTKQQRELCMKWTRELCKKVGENDERCKMAKERCEMIYVKATPAKKGVKFAMALDLNKCIGCRRCAYACVMENNQARNEGIEWIRVIAVPREEFPEIVGSQMFYKEAPERGMVYIPIACMHCENPPCVMVCPVRATWKEPDGIVVVDYDRCIGCRYCATACPYGARRYNFTVPYVPPYQINPNMHILGNVIRQPHVIEKCTWCIQRTRDGGVPACVEICPVGARVFGDLNDPNSPIREIAEKYGLFVLKPEAGTKPKFFYFFGPARTPPQPKPVPGAKEGKEGGGEA